MPLRRDLTLAALLLLALPQTARAASPTVAVGGGTLGSAIIELGAQTGASIGIHDQRLAALPVPRVAGRLSVEAALRRLLRNLSVEVRRLPGGGWLIVAKAVSTPQRHSPAPAMPASAARREQPAQPPENFDPVPVVITASKRDTAIEAMPATVTVVAGDQMVAAPDGANGAALASRVVGVSSTHFGSGRNKLFVRGIADSGFSGPTQATVGQYLGNARISYSAPDPDLRLYDLLSIEILEGPQGTLYGAGSLGGIIRAVPVPVNFTAIEARAIGSLTITKDGKPGYELVGIANLPLVEDRIALRASAYSALEGGYVDDTLRGLTDVNRTITRGGRAALGIRLSDDWQAEAMGAYQHIGARDAQYADLGEPGIARRSRIAQPFHQNYAMGNLRVQGRTGDVRINAELGLIDNRSFEVYDASDLGEQEQRFAPWLRSRIVTGEARLAYQGSHGLGVLTGIAFVSGSSQTGRELGQNNIGAYRIAIGSRIREWTAFGELSFDLAPRLQVTGGGRLSSIRLVRERDYTLPASGLGQSDPPAPRDDRIAAPSAALLYRFGRDATWFARYQQGYRPGGVAIDGQSAQSFGKDTISTAETGLRFGQARGSMVSGQIALAWSQWHNIQADIADRIGLPVTINIGNGRIFSASAQLAIAPTERLAMEAALQFNNSRLSEPLARVLLADTRLEVAQGRSTLPNVADVSARMALRYGGTINRDWSWDTNLALRYTGRSRFGLGDRFDKLQGGFLQSSMMLRLRRETLDLFMLLSNLADDRSSRFGIGNPFSADLSGQYVPQRPRSITFGVEVGF